MNYVDYRTFGFHWTNKAYGEETLKALVILYQSGCETAKHLVEEAKTCRLSPAQVSWILIRSEK